MTLLVAVLEGREKYLFSTTQKSHTSVLFYIYLYIESPPARAAITKIAYLMLQWSFAFSLSHAHLRLRYKDLH